MNGADAFFDTNICVYVISAHAEKRDRAKALLARRGVVSVQVLNEFVAVTAGKFRIAWPIVREVLATIRAVCRVEPLSIEIHERGVSLSERYGFNIYDSLIVAAALHAGCKLLYSEDMQHGQVLEGLTILDPFR